MKKRLVVVTLLGFVVGYSLLEFLQTQEKADLVEKEKVEYLTDCITRKSCSELIETVQLLGKHVKILGVQSHHPDIFIAVYQPGSLSVSVTNSESTLVASVEDLNLDGRIDRFRVFSVIDGTVFYDAPIQDTERKTEQSHFNKVINSAYQQNFSSQLK